MLVRGARLALYTVLGEVGVYLPRLERCEVVGPDANSSLEVVTRSVSFDVLAMMSDSAPGVLQFQKQSCRHIIFLLSKL